MKSNRYLYFVKSMSYFLISNNDNDVNNSLNNNDDDYKLSISVYLSGLLKYVES